MTGPASIADYMSLIRFSHTIFALPFAALAAVWAWNWPLPVGEAPAFRIRDAVALLLCMVTARSAAMAFNRVVDHRIDAANPRTAGRHLPAGIISRPAAIGFAAACGLAFWASTALFWPNWVPAAAAPVVLAWLCGYSLAKRFTSGAHLWLGTALALSPLCVWAAVRGPAVLVVPADWITPGLLAIAVAFWVAGFDIIYACQDAEFDAAGGWHSVPGKWGVSGALRIAAVSHTVMLTVLVVLAWYGWQSDTVALGWIFAAAVAITAGLVVGQHALVNGRDLSRVGEAFFHANASVSVILLLGGVLDCYV